MSNNDLTKTIIGSKTGSGTETVTLDISTKKSIVCACKKSSTLIHCIEIPVTLLTSGTVIPLGQSAPIIGTDNVFVDAGYPLNNEMVGEQLYAWQTSANYPNTFTLSKTSTGEHIGNNKSIGLAADLSNAIDASITYNGNNSFTLKSVSGLTVYLLA